MQNTLAALLPIAPVAEVMGPAVATDGGDGLFGETFVELVSTAEPFQKADETAAASLVSPVVWGVLFLATPAPPTSAEFASDQDAVPASQGTLIEDLPASSASTDVEGVSGPIVQQSTQQPEEGSLSSTANGLSLQLSAGDYGVLDSLPVALERPLEEHRALPVPTMTAGSSEVLKPVRPADLMGVAPPEVTPPRKSALEDHARPAALEAEGMLAVVNGLASKDAGLTVEPENKPTRPEASTTAATAASPILMKDPGKTRIDLPAPDDAQASTLRGRSVPADTGAIDQAVLSDAPVLRATEQPQPSAGATLVEPAGYPAEGQGSARLPAETHKNHFDLELSADPHVDEASDRGPHVVTFWERFFSTKSAETPPRTPFRPDVPLEMGVPSPGAAVIHVGSGSVPEPEPESATSQATSALNSAIERPTFPALSTAAAWSREQLVDILSKALPQMVFADWHGDLSLANQQAELSLSSIPVPSGGATPGSPNSTLVSPHFPVPQIASQIASVLVRNDRSVTELALSPEELGKIRLRMEPDSANPDRMVILISVERPETLDLFRRHAGDLAEAIRSAGYSGADIGFGQNTQDNGSEHRRESASTGPGIPFEEIGLVETARPHSLGAALDLRL